MTRITRTAAQPNARQPTRVRTAEERRSSAIARAAAIEVLG